MKKVFIFLIFSSFLSFNLKAQWNQSFIGVNLSRDISVVNDNVVWVSDPASPSFSLTTDGGNSWVTKDFPSILNSGTDQHGVLSAVSATTAYTVLAGAGFDNGIYITTDGGDTWVKQTTGFNQTSPFPDFVYFWDLNNGVAVGDASIFSPDFEIYTTKDGGAHWVSVPAENMPAGNSEWTVNDRSDAFRVHADTIYFITSGAKIFKSTNRGLNWTVINTPFKNMGNFDFKDTNNGLFFAEGGTNDTIYATNDGGQNWTKTNSLVANGSLLNYLPSVNAYVCTNNGLSYSTDDGKTWLTNPSFNGVNLNSVGYSPSGKIFICGKGNNYIYNSTNFSGTNLRVIKTQITSSANLDVTFSANVDLQTSQDTSNYSITYYQNNSIQKLNIQQAIRDNLNNATVHLNTETPIPCGYIITTFVKNVRDINAFPVINGTVWDSSTTISLLPLSFPADTITIDGMENSTTSFKITSDADWNVTCLAYWIQTNIASGSGNTSLSFSALKNPTTVNREATIIFSENTIPVKTLTIIQTGNLTLFADSWIQITQNHVLNSVYFADANTGYAVGQGGTILKTGNGGRTWDQINSGTKHDLNSVYFIDANNGYAVGQGGIILKTSSGGSIWSLQYSGTMNSLFSVYFISANTGYIAGEKGAILKTTDGGNTWLTQTSGIAPDSLGMIKSLRSVCFTNSNTGYVVGDSGIIIKTSNGGNFWDKLNSGVTNNLRSVYFTDSNTGYVEGDSGVSLKTINGGNIWGRQNSGVLKNLGSVCFTDSTTGYAVGDQGTILKTINSGSTWTIQNSTVTKNLRSVFFTDAHTGYALGDSDIILKTNDGGITWGSIVNLCGRWDVQISGVTKSLHSVYFTSLNTGYAVGDSGTLIKTTDGGITWSLQSSGVTKILRSVFFLNNNVGYITGDRGTILKTINGGNTWTSLQTTDTTDLYSVYFTNANTGYAGGHSGNMLAIANWQDGVYKGWLGVGGHMLRTSDGGNTWTEQSLPSAGLLSSIFFTDANTGYAVGEFGTILKSTNGGSTWEGKYLPNTFISLYSVYFTDAQTGYAVGNYSQPTMNEGIILKTTDGGTTWNEQSFPYVILFSSVCFTSASTGYAVGLYGAIFQTGSNCAIRTNTANSLRSVFFIGPNTGYAVGDGGIILKYSGPSVLSVSTNAINIPSSANSNATFNITSNINWNVNSDQTWLAINKHSGSNADTIKVTALQNPASNTRSAKVIISGVGVTSDTITVTQSAATASLSVSPITLSIAPADNSSATFDIASNISWTVSSDQAWLTISNTSGTDSATITVTASANTTTSLRSAIITVSGSGVSSKIITITQASINTGLLDVSDTIISIYPIPVIDKMIILYSKQFSQARFSIYTLSGTLVYTSEIFDTKTEVDMQNYASGVYIVKIISLNQGILVRKVIKQ